MKSLLPAALSGLVSLLGGMISGGPWGALVGVLGLAAAVGGSLWLYGKYRDFVFNQTDTHEHEDASHDQGTVISDNQHQSTGDASTINQSEQDKLNAIKNGQ